MMPFETDPDEKHQDSYDFLCGNRFPSSKLYDPDDSSLFYKNVDEDGDNEDEEFEYSYDDHNEDDEDDNSIDKSKSIAITGN